jgi:hypothetical protein
VLKFDTKNTQPLPLRFARARVEFHNTFHVTVSPTDRFKGKTYAQWSAKWWEWYLEYPVNDPKHPHPVLDENSDVHAFADVANFAICDFRGPVGHSERVYHELARARISGKQKRHQLTKAISWHTLFSKWHTR